MAFAGEQIEQAQETDALNQPADEQQRTNLSEGGVETVVDKREQGVGDSAKNTGEGQQAADYQGCDAVADAGRVAGKTDQKIHGHAVEGVKSDKDDLPEFGAAVVNTVDLTLRESFFCHDVFLPFFFCCCDCIGCDCIVRNKRAAVKPLIPKKLHSFRKLLHDLIRA